MWQVLMRRKFVLGGAAILASGAIATCAVTQDHAVPPAGETTIALHLTELDVADIDIGQLTVTMGFDITSPSDRVGGVSGMAVMAQRDGVTGVFITDAGDKIRLDLGGLDREAGPPMEEGNTGGLVRLTDARGPLGTGKSRADAEDIAVLPGGGLAVSFERDHRVIISAPYGDAVGELHWPENSPSLTDNGGLEALAVTADGTLYAGGEKPLFNGGYPIWRLRPERGGEAGGLVPYPQPGAPDFALASPGIGFGLTGADATPDGGLVVLFRRWIPGVGNAAVIGHVPGDVLGAAAPGAVLTPVELARLPHDGPLLTDNFEGIAYVPGDMGISGEHGMIWIVSDDNFRSQQRTLLYALRWNAASEGEEGIN